MWFFTAFERDISVLFFCLLHLAFPESPVASHAHTVGVTDEEAMVIVYCHVK